MVFFFFSFFSAWISGDVGGQARRRGGVNTAPAGLIMRPPPASVHRPPAPHPSVARPRRAPAAAKVLRAAGLRQPLAEAPARRPGSLPAGLPPPPLPSPPSRRRDEGDGSGRSPPAGLLPRAGSGLPCKAGPEPPCKNTPAPPPAAIRLRKHDVGKAAEAAAPHPPTPSPRPLPRLLSPRDKWEGENGGTCKVLLLLKPAEAFDPLSLPRRDVRPWKSKGANLTTSAGTLHFENTFAKESNLEGGGGGG